MDKKTFGIPTSHLEKIDAYIKLPDAVKQTIKSRINTAEVGMSPNAIASTLAEELAMPLEKMYDIMVVQVNLSSVRKRYENDEDFKLALYEALQTVLNGENDVVFSSIEYVIDQLIDLTESTNDNALITARAMQVIIDNDKVFLDSDFKLDIRPVFDAKNSDKYLGVVNIFRLKISFRENDETKDAYFALDKEDLKKLKDQISSIERQGEIFVKGQSFKVIDIK